MDCQVHAEQPTAGPGGRHGAAAGAAGAPRVPAPRPGDAHPVGRLRARARPTARQQPATPHRPGEAGATGSTRQRPGAPTAQAPRFEAPLLPPLTPLDLKHTGPPGVQVLRVKASAGWSFDLALRPGSDPELRLRLASLPEVLQVCGPPRPSRPPRGCSRDGQRSQRQAVCGRCGRQQAALWGPANKVLPSRTAGSGSCPHCIAGTCNTPPRPLRSRRTTGLWWRRCCGISTVLTLNWKAAAAPAAQPAVAPPWPCTSPGCSDWAAPGGPGQSCGWRS